MDVQIDVDCGNAPRKAQVRDWLIAVAQGDPDEVGRLLSEDVSWEAVGSSTIHGRDVVLAGLRSEPARTLVVASLLSHGKFVAAEGSMLSADGGSERFAYFFTFTGHAKTALIGSVIRFAIGA
jgi:hypothetical protein